MNFVNGDIIYELFKHLSINDAYQLSIVNSTFYNIFECPKLWNHNVYKSIDLDVLSIIQVRCYKSTYKKFSDLNKIIKLFKLDVDVPVLLKIDLIDLSLSRQITSIPSEIGHLVNLQRLNLSYNLIISMPREIGQLVNLQQLNLNNLIILFKSLNFLYVDL